MANNRIEIGKQIKDDLAYKYSIEHKDVINMQMVLRAYGYDHSFEAAQAQLRFELPTSLSEIGF